MVDFSKRESVAVVDISSALRPIESRTMSPIDEYYLRAGKLLQRAQKAEIDGEHELIPLLFLRLISATESYFRQLLTKLPYICPLARRHAANCQVALGAGHYYSSMDLAMATLEHSSLCTAGELTKQTKKLTNFVCESDSSLREAIVKFENVSQLRHAVVHAYDEVAFVNLEKLNIVQPTVLLHVSITPLLFQQFVAVCHSVVRAFNRSISTWILDQWRQRSVLSWEWRSDRTLFNAFYGAFYSKEDASVLDSAYQVYRKLRADISNRTA